VLGDEYVRLYLRKSSTDIYVERSFRKADDTISYIGGLFSVIVVLMFMINAYNETCYEVEVAKSILRDDQGHPIHSDSFNLFTYFSYSLSQFLECFGCSPISQHVAVYSDALDEIRKQMDVRLMMKRLGYCEKGLQILLEDHRAKVLHLQRPLTLDEV
jgi:p-aminobenzoyl-glutamate transporter AbgT